MTDTTNADTKPYRPSNGSEGRSFQAMTCDVCVHDHAAHRGDYEGGCPIFSRTLAFDATSKDYPSEWAYQRFVEWTDAPLTEWQDGYARQFLHPETSIMILDMKSAADPIHEDLRRFILEVRD